MLRFPKLAFPLLLAAALQLGCACEVERRHDPPQDTSHLMELLSAHEIAEEQPGTGQNAEVGSRVRYDYRIGYVDGPRIHEGSLSAIVFDHSSSRIEGVVAHGLAAGAHRTVQLPPDAPLHCGRRVCSFDDVPYRRDRGALELEIAVNDVCVPQDLILWRGRSGILGELSVPWRCR